MMKNKLIDLNDHLFAQMERLSEEGLKGEELEKEVLRTKAITDVAKEIVSNGKLVLEAKTLVKEYMIKDEDIPKMLEG